MRLLEAVFLRGPNIWARCPVVEARVDLAEWEDRPSCAVADLARRLSGWLPGIVRRMEADSVPLQGGRGLARALEVTALELQALAGVPVSFGVVQETADNSVYKVVFEYRDEVLARDCLEAAREICLGAACPAFDPSPAIARVREVAALNLMGPSTSAIVDSAGRRGIPFFRLDRESLVQLGHAKKQRRIRAAETDLTGAVAEGIAQDKELTRQVLQAVGVPVPSGYAVTSPEESRETASDWVGMPVVVKPRYGNQGRGVTVGATTCDQVVAAYHAALEEGPAVIVEEYIAGRDYRLLVVNGKMVAAARREPPCVRGDGVRTIRLLVEEENHDSRRSDHHANVLSRIPLDDVALQVLADQGYAPESVPAAGERVLIRRNANLSTGGTAADVTSLVHPQVAAHAVAAASVVGLDVAGVDVIAHDISVPLEQQHGAVVEVNAAPGLRMHLAPSEGAAHEVGDAIVGMLFPPGEEGRIPIVAVTGANGKTTVTRFLDHILRGAGRYVGMACTDGIFLNGRRTCAEDCSGPLSAAEVLMSPNVETAVLETARGGILRAGLGFDRCQVAVVTNIADGDHLGLEGIETPADLARVKRTIVRVVSADGAAVLNAEDPLVAAMAAHCPGGVVYFGVDGSGPVIAGHRAAGGSAIFVRQGTVVLAGPEGERELVPLDEIPLTFRGCVPFEVENALAALGAAWAMGIGRDALVQGARSFSTTMEHVPGRLNVIETRGATVLVDYAHNASALKAIAGVLDLFPHRRRIAIFTMAGDRRDDDIIRVGEMLGDAFDEVVIYEAHTSRGRAPGEIGAFLRQGLCRGARIREVREIDSSVDAMQQTLDRLEPGDLLLLQPNEVDEAVQFVREYVCGGRVTEATVPQRPVRRVARPRGLPGGDGD